MNAKTIEAQPVGRVDQRGPAGGGDRIVWTSEHGALPHDTELYAFPVRGKGPVSSSRSHSALAARLLAGKVSLEDMLQAAAIVEQAASAGAAAGGGGHLPTRQAIGDLRDGLLRWHESIDEAQGAAQAGLRQSLRLGARLLNVLYSALSGEPAPSVEHVSQPLPDAACEAVAEESAA